MLLLRSQNQLVPDDFRRLMLVKSPRDRGMVQSKPPILSDNFSKINVKQAVAMNQLGRDPSKPSGAVGPLLVSTGGALSLQPS